VDVAYQLDREWSLLARNEVAAALPHWQEREPALRRFCSPRELLAFLHSAPAEQTDAPLLALLALARERRLAGRTLLQVLLPALKTRADRFACPASCQRDEVWELLLYTAWETICGYPLERRRRVAANLVLQVVHRTTRELRPPQFCVEVGGQLARDDCAAPPDPVAPEAVVLAGVTAGVISPEDADLILLTRVDGIRLLEVARTLGIGYHGLRQRRQRAERRLRQLLDSLVDVSKRPVSDPVFHAGTFRLSRRARAAAPSPSDVPAKRAA
jgi:DNA-directed RNA polymerase specialized sigma24 family protein